MPGTKRRIHPGLIQRLKNAPYRFEFFQTVRLLLQHYREHSTEQDGDVLGQVIRFRSSVSLSFPPSEIESLEFEWEDTSEPEDKIPDVSWIEKPMHFRKVTLTPSFIGLTGPMGVLPRHYTQHIAEREMSHRDGATRAFLDIFNTRAIALFYQAWLKYRLHLQYEADQENRFLPLILRLAGLGLSGTRRRLEEGGAGIADESLAYYVSALRERPQSVQWFARVVADYFGVSCHVEQFVGQWFSLPDTEYTRLGQSHCSLGKSAFCGGRVWDRQTKVRLKIGPLRRTQFDDLLPNGEAAHKLENFFRLMVGTIYDCEVCLILDRLDVVPASLNSRQGSVRLGWNGWITSSNPLFDSHDAAYLIRASVPV